MNNILPIRNWYKTIWNLFMSHSHTVISQKTTESSEPTEFKLEFILPHGEVYLVTPKWIASKLRVNLAEATVIHIQCMNVLRYYASDYSWVDGQTQVSLDILNSLISAHARFCEKPIETVTTCRYYDIVEKQGRDRKIIQDLETLLYKAFPLYFNKQCYPSIQALHLLLKTDLDDYSYRDKSLLVCGRGIEISVRLKGSYETNLLEKRIQRMENLKVVEKLKKLGVYSCINDWQQISIPWFSVPLLNQQMKNHTLKSSETKITNKLKTLTLFSDIQQATPTTIPQLSLTSPEEQLYDYGAP